MKEMAKHRQFQRMHGLPPVPPPPHPFRIEDQLMRDRVDLNLRLVGELCHIARPLAYALARRRWGCKSWRALMVSATFDAASFSCLNGASGGIKRREPNFSSGEKAEMARRRAFLTYYLLRSPVFDTLTLPTARLVGRGVGWVPLLGSLYGKAVDIAEDVNDHFAYTY
jgi:peroxin-16